jgi:hypothetical protein
MPMRQRPGVPTMRHRPRKLAAWLLVATVFLAACGGSGTTSGSAATSVPASAATTPPTAAPEATTAASGATVVAKPTPAPPSTGTIVGMVTDRDTAAPLAGVYIIVGYKSLKLSTITGADGHYTVNNVPAGEPADVLGFTGRGYRYHNSSYDDKLKIVLKPGETYTYNFTTFKLNDPAGEPQVTSPSISSGTAAPGQEVTLSLTARGGKGGLSDEVIAASPQLGRLVLLMPAEGDRFSSSFTVPMGTAPGDYAFAFFAASNECYDNADFPKLTLHVT